MKKRLLLALILAFSANAAWSQGSVLKINILSPVVKTFNIQYEKKIDANSSFQMGFFYTGYSDSGDKWTGFGITPEYRFYLTETEAPQGVYAAPFLRYQNMKASNDLGDAGTLSAFGGGLILGKQWIFKEKVALDLFIGPAYYAGSVKQTAGTGTIDEGPFNGFTVRFGVCFGLAF